MSVWDIVQQFTDDDFILIVYDLATDTELYNGPASDVYDDPVGSAQVISMEPPRRELEVVLNVDSSDDELDYAEADEVLYEI